jgi:hypothetical protein
VFEAETELAGRDVGAVDCCCCSSEVVVTGEGKFGTGIEEAVVSVPVAWELGARDKVLLAEACNGRLEVLAEGEPLLNPISERAAFNPDI